MCGCKVWLVTARWAHCKDCDKGYRTDYPFTAGGSTMSILDEHGVRDWDDEDDEDDY